MWPVQIVIMVGMGLMLPHGPVAAQQGGRAPAAASTATAPAPPRVAIVFKCPKSGTVIETTTQAQINERTSLGADPADPTLCISKSGFTTTETYYSRFSRNIGAEGLAELRQGLADLFAGRKEQFTSRFQTASAGGGRFTYEQTWCRLGSEAIGLAGRQVQTVVFEKAERNLEANFQGVEKIWYDPTSGVWLKRMATAGGETSRNWAINWEVTRITEP